MFEYCQWQNCYWNDVNTETELKLFLKNFIETRTEIIQILYRNLYWNDWSQTLYKLKLKWFWELKYHCNLVTSDLLKLLCLLLLARVHDSHVTSDLLLLLIFCKMLTLCMACAGDSCLYISEWSANVLDTRSCTEYVNAGAVVWLKSAACTVCLLHCYCLVAMNDVQQTQFIWRRLVMLVWS